MEHIEAVKLIQEIENKYPVRDIKYNGISIWPFLRIYFADSQSSTKRELKANKKTIITVLVSLFYYGVLNLFRKKVIWTFTNVERRKILGNKAVHRVCGAIGELANKDTLFFEKPVPGFKPARKNEVMEDCIISESILILLTAILQKTCRSAYNKMTGFEILEKILKDYNFSFNYKERINHFAAQYNSMKLILKVTHRPNVAFLESPFSIMGYVLALKESGVRTIELQHGVINSNHLGYNYRYKCPELFPDAICVYGNEELQFLTKQQPNYCKDVYNIGYYFIDKASKFFTDDLFSEFRSFYSQIVVVSGQVPEDEIYEFTKKVAQNNPKVLFVYIPRFGLDDETSCQNLIIKNNANIYQNIKWCDVHVTMFSTTCIEAQYFDKPTIFYNINGLSEKYYGDSLSRENGCFYVNSIEEFNAALNIIPMGHFKYKRAFTPNAIANFKELLESLKK